MDIANEFDRLRKANVNFSMSALRMIALHVIRNELIERDIGGQRMYLRELKDIKSGKKIINQINFRWIQGFIQANNIVSRSQTGKMVCITANTEPIEREVAYHLGSVHVILFLVCSMRGTSSTRMRPIL